MSASGAMLQPMLQVVWTATAASLIVCICFAFVLRALDNAAAARHAHRSADMVRYALISAMPFAVCLGAVGFAVSVLSAG